MFGNIQEIVFYYFFFHNIEELSSVSDITQHTSAARYDNMKKFTRSSFYTLKVFLY